MDKKLITVTEVGAWLGLSIDRVYSLSREGIIPSVRIKRTLRFSTEAISQFINAGGKGLD